MPRYSSIVMDHFNSPRNVGMLKAPDAVGTTGGPSNPPAMVMHFRIEDQRVTEVKYEVFGCGAAIAAGSMLTEMMTNLSIQECLALTRQRLTDALGGLPADKVWCADLALAAMRNALEKSNGKAT